MEMCGDPQCPNKRRVEELESQVTALKMLLDKTTQLADLENEITRLKAQLAERQPKI